ncbi:2-(3-amino-3-carboxypropyl)histidine synthase subunit 2 [Mycena indigotica]|uniref:2-(3-amino-3-carboxypropyl)histidine synthase subunit 2 n=1 Tax=Mycena indigotica TaxID=2126181 RepID=A0A8H6S114_9AGAR|nr:2-(3-amino-3-carboxypropyl)histidine synthase subunit 2 [Mycena indigotica]KAF7290668.1 2-(3-amino-3-carboxypropyl)histidine synthase subunit 2 [Mycena indigotica]
MAEGTFSASGADVISRQIEIEGTPSNRSRAELEDFFDIKRTIASILAGDYKRIALQFPDELLHESVPIYRQLKAGLGASRELYVLADTSYGSCCVDEVAAQHVEADAVVHYGYACMSLTSRLPVIYQVATIFQGTSAILKYDVGYSHQAENIATALRKTLKISVYSQQLDLVSPPSQTLREDDSDRDEVSSIIYIGGESLGLTNLLMTHSQSLVYSYDPTSRMARIESSRTNRLLMRRYVAVQKARDADVFAILVGTLGVASYLPLIKHLRAILSRAHKKSYTISVGKLNPAKLANFMEVECFVLVACPENSIVEAKEFLRPIITPFELEIALQSEQSWTGKYVLDFGKLLAESSSSAESPADPADPDQPVFSVVTGKYRHMKRFGDDTRKPAEGDLEAPSSSSSSLVVRNQDTTLALADSAGAQFFQERTFRGLEARIGQDAPSILEQGRSGIARGYADDHN